MKGLIGLQMMHRFSAYLLLALTIITALRSRRSGDARLASGAATALGLTVLQIVLGVLNVRLGTPVWLSAAHLATATAIFAILAITLFHAARPSARPRAVPAPAAS